MQLNGIGIVFGHSLDTMQDNVQNFKEEFQSLANRVEALTI